MPTPQTFRELNAFVTRKTVCDVERVEFISVTVPDDVVFGESFIVLWATTGAGTVTIAVQGGTPGRVVEGAAGACEIVPTTLTGVLTVTFTAKSAHSSVGPVTITKKITVAATTPTIWLSHHDIALTPGEELVLQWSTQHAVSVQLHRDGESNPRVLKNKGSLCVEVDDSGERFEFIATGATGKTATARCVARVLKPLAISRPFEPTAAFQNPFSPWR